MDIKSMYEHILKRADEIFEYTNENELDFLGFDAYKLLNHDYFNFMYYKGDLSIMFIETAYEDGYPDSTVTVPLILFESENWKDLLVEMNDIGLKKLKEKEELEYNQKKEKEYQDYLKLKEKFEGGK